MGKRRDNTLEVMATEDGFVEAERFVQAMLENEIPSGETSGQVGIVFDGLFHSILLQGYDEDTLLHVSGERRLGNFDLVVGFGGPRFDPTVRDDDLSLEAKILEGYSDKISYGYHSGYNSIRISAHRGPTGTLAMCAVGIVLAVLTYLVLGQSVDEASRIEFLEGYVVPLERLFTNAMLMLAAPMTFFSLLKNTTDTFILATGNSRARRLQAKTIVTSVVAILLGFATGWVIAALLGENLESHIYEQAAGVHWSFAEFVNPIIPESVFAAFEDISPFPLIVVSLLATYAMSTVGHHFDVLKVGIDAGYALFSRMLRVVMAALPVACFLSFLDVLLKRGLPSLLGVAAYIAIAIASCGVLMATYAARLRFAGIRARDYLHTILPLIRENYHIGSTIEAVPFNTRYCSRNYGMDHGLLESCLPILAQVNLDGNCFLLMLISMLYFLGAAKDINPFSVIAVQVVVLFLSLGAPNQPGSILIGSLIIIAYLGSVEMLPAAIYLEVFLGGIQNGINVISGIVMVAEEQRHHPPTASR